MLFSRNFRSKPLFLCLWVVVRIVESYVRVCACVRLCASSLLFLSSTL
nr:MAG TPA: Proteasome alpha1 chain, Proteasome alpha2 20S subunit, hydrolase [Caudoviricetes sp.]